MNKGLIKGIMFKRTLFITLASALLITILSGCSSVKQGLQTVGSLAGASYARNKGENALLGSIAGGIIGNLAGQMITQARPY